MNIKFLNFSFNKSSQPKPESNLIENFQGFAGTVLMADSKKSYTIEKKLGSGGFADVYLVKNKLNNYALKILRMWALMPEEREEILYRFEREYTCSSIDSPYLVRSYDKGTHLGNPFYLMEYCPKGCLADRIGFPTNETEIRHVAIRILKGLRDLHKEGIIHRDLKPVNVLFNKNDEAVLTDFGISGYLKSRITVRNWLGHVKKIFGTVAYMPPEQLNAKEAFLSLGPVTDIFAFGVTMHEFLTKGQFPFGTYSEAEEEQFLNRLIHGKSIVFDKVKKSMPPLWGKVISGCIHPNPGSRYPSAQSILDILQIEGQTGEPKLSAEYKSGIYILKIKQGDEHGKAYSLTELRKKKKSNILTIGWSDHKNPGNNDINIVETITNYISKHHATLEFNEGDNTWSIRDGQWLTKNNQSDWYRSTNGALVNSHKISDEGFLICDGDIITLGDTTLKVEVI